MEILSLDSPKELSKITDYIDYIGEHHISTYSHKQLFSTHLCRSPGQSTIFQAGPRIAGHWTESHKSKATRWSWKVLCDPKWQFLQWYVRG
jgi:hypothetical protein